MFPINLAIMYQASFLLLQNAGWDIFSVQYNQCFIVFFCKKIADYKLGDNNY